MGTLVNSEDPDEMQHNAAFHQRLHCLLRLKQPLGTEIHHNLEDATCDLFNTQWTVPFLLYQYVWENPSGYKGLKLSISGL